MFNKIIIRYFDLETGESLYSEPIFSKLNKDIFGFVLAELLDFAEGKKIAKQDDATVLRFQKYFSEAKNILADGIAKNLSPANLNSSEKESGALIACFIVWGKRLYSDLTSNTIGMLTVPKDKPSIEIWLKNPKANGQIAEVLSFMIKFNADLNDVIAREIVEASK